MVYEGQTVPRDKLGRQVPKDLRANKESKEPQGNLELLELMELLVSLVLRAP